MESLSFESTIESPIKPPQEKAPDKNNKSLLLFQVIPDNKTSEQKSQNLENNEIGENEKIIKSSNTLNFDAILEIVFPKEKPKQSNKKKCEKKLVGNKRKRQLRSNNKSKNIINL
jgi:hypothetical protein